MHTPSKPLPPREWQALPKVSLHEHIDGSLRPHTLWELSRARGLPLPCEHPDGWMPWLQTHAHTGDLPRYLQAFDFCVAAMATPQACERVARELAQDAWADGCVLAEFRVAPQLFAPWGLSAEAALDAVLQGLSDSPMPCGLVVCGMRHLSSDSTRAAAELAVRARERGVVGFDLAGSERGHPPGTHATALALAREGGLGVTVHAGEADAGHRVLEAARCGATRIGHGVRVTDQRAWMQEALALGLHFEVCPSSNVHTGAAVSLEQHPIKGMLEAGLSVSCSPDNRGVSCTTLSQELALLHERQGLSLAVLQHMQQAALVASFLPADTKARISLDWGFARDKPVNGQG